MNDDKTSHVVPAEDADTTAATIAVALAAAAERIVPVAGTDLTQPSNAPEEAHAPTEAASHTEKEQHR